MWRLASRAVAECDDWYRAKICTEQKIHQECRKDRKSEDGKMAHV